MTTNAPPQLTEYLRSKGELGRSTIADLLDEKDRREYSGSLFKSLFRLARRERPAGLAGAVSKFLETLNPDRRSEEFEILAPLDMLLQKRALGASTGSTGGFLVGVDVGPLELILRPVSVILRLGGMFLPGLKSNLTIPRQLTESTPYQWLAEGDTVSLADESFGQVAVTPHRLGGGCVLTKQLEHQTVPGISDHVADSLARGIFAAYDKAAFQGTGALGQPLGIFNSPVLTETFSGAATLTTVADMETKLAAANVTNPIAFVADPLTRAKWRTIARTTNSSKTLWDDDDGVENVLGHPAVVTTNCPASSVMAANFSKTIIFAVFGEGSPVSLVVDPYSQKRSEKIEIVGHLHGDIAIANVNAVCVSSGSTTQ